MSKSKITGLNDWTLIKHIPKNIRKVKAKINFIYPNIKSVLNLTPKERIAFIDKKHNEALKKIVNLDFFESYTVIGSTKRPTGVQVNITYSNLIKLEKLRYVKSIFIQKIEGGKQATYKASNNLGFYCIKMTVAVEIEGVKNGFQTYEERYVLIKASSFDNAYHKIEKSKKKYSTPYLNSDGQLVRWRIESMDDCYQTDMIKLNDLNNSEGIEVYSKLKKRKLSKDRVWNGKLDS
jgi:hypothetical protein